MWTESTYACAYVHMYVINFTLCTSCANPPYTYVGGCVCVYSDKMVIVCLCKVCTYICLCIVLKEQIEEMKKKEERLEKVLAETQAENKRLQEPLQRVGPLASLVVTV